MTKVSRFAGKVIKGRLTLVDEDGFKLKLNEFDGDVTLIIKQRGFTRSPKQNNYYRGVLVKILAEDFGYTDYEMHAVLKKHFNVESTKHLDQREFRDYLDKIIRWASMEYGIALPDPE